MPSVRVICGSNFNRCEKVHENVHKVLKMFKRYFIKQYTPSLKNRSNSDMECMYVYSNLTCDQIRLMKNILRNNRSLIDYREIIISDPGKCYRNKKEPQSCQDSTSEVSAKSKSKSDESNESDKSDESVNSDVLTHSSKVSFTSKSETKSWSHGKHTTKQLKKKKEANKKKTIHNKSRPPSSMSLTLSCQSSESNTKRKYRSKKSKSKSNTNTRRKEEISILIKRLDEILHQLRVIHS